MIIIKKKNRKNTETFIKKIDREYNYLIVDRSGNPDKLIFHNYKTKRECGKQEFDITDKTLIKTLREYIRYVDMNNGDYLFRKKNNKPWKNQWS